MRPGTALAVAGLGGLALVAAAGAVSTQRQRDRELSPIPSVENAGPRGLAAARGWLEATGRPSRVLTGDAVPVPGEVVLLVAPPAPLTEAQASALLSHAERGGLVLWAMGRTAQPALERRLGVERTARGEDGASVDAAPLAPHPLFDGIRLRTGGASLATLAPSAHPVAGTRERTAAAVVTVGAGEAIVLAGPDALESFRLADAENLSLLARLSSFGPIAFDERHLQAAVAASPAWRRSLLALGAQGLLAATALLLALGRRLGAVRVRVDLSGGRSARDYLASLGALYRRSGGEAELAAEAWRSLRRTIELRAHLSVRLPDAEVERRLAARAPAAGRAFAEALAARRVEPAWRGLPALVRAAAETEAALARTSSEALVTVR